MLGAKKERIVVEELFKKFSYRYTIDESRSVLNTLRYLKQALTLLNKRSDELLNYASQKLVYDGKQMHLSYRKEYLNLITTEKFTYLFRDSLINELNWLEKRINSLFLLSIFFLVWPVTFFKRDRSKPSLILLELTEALLVHKIVKKYIMQEVLIFSAYEKDINFLSYFLGSSLKVKVKFIPSPNPLSLHYKNVICDTFIFTAPFQTREVKNSTLFNWYVKETKIWPPHGFDQVVINPDPEKPAAEAIGFMSSGTMLRKHLNHTNNTGNADFEAEKAIIEALEKYRTRIGKTVIVFLHPLEKATPDNLEFSEAFYKKSFGAGVKFAPYDQPSKKCFELCDVAISGFSSVQIERLYGGYKALFAPMGFFKDYFGDERLNTISANNYNDLDNLLTICREISADEFFRKFNLTDYRWDAFQENVDVTKRR